MAKFIDTPTRLLLTLPEYERIYNVIYSILEGRANTPHACMFFAIAGTLILKKHYNIPARPVAGAFLLCVNETPSVFCIGKRGDGVVTSDKDGFHFWVQTEHHAIDFMAPIFKESAHGGGHDIAVPRKMFQRLSDEEVGSIDSLAKPGDYFTLPNLELTEEIIDDFFERAPDTDLLLVCDRWFKKHPKKLDDMALLDDLGKMHKLVLAAPAVSGAW